MDVNLVKAPMAGIVNTSTAVADNTPKTDGDNAAAQAGKSPDKTDGKEKGDKQIKLTRGDVDLLSQTLNKFMESINADLQFVIHTKTHRMMVQLVDPKNQKVLKEFPPHELLDTLAAISDYVGALLDKKA